MPTVPVITQGSSRTLTTTVYDVLDSRIRQRGSVYKVIVAGSQNWYENTLGNAAANLNGVAFVLAGTAFEFALRTPVTNGSTIRIKVDGVYIIPPWIVTGGAGSNVFIKVDFGTYATRHIVIESAVAQWGAGDQASGKGFIGVGAGDSLVTSSRSRSKRLLVVGDSIPYGATSTSQWAAFPQILGPLIGCNEVAMDTVGSSGYKQTASGAVTAISTRITTTKTYAADVALFCAGVNDNPSNGTGFEVATVVAVAQDVWAQYRAANPNAYIVVSGAMPTSPAEGQIVALQAIQAGLYAAASTDPNVNLAVDVGTWIASAQVSRYMPSGSPHVGDDGADYYARRFATLINAARGV